MARDAQVHRVVARCLVDPAFLQRLEDDDSSALAGYQLDDGTVREFKTIAGQLRKYAGLIATVQNNGLWQHIPATRLLLKRHDLDLRTFVAFRAQHQANRARRGLGRDVSTATFFEFFGELLITDSQYHRPMLAEVFGHERLVWEMQRAAVDPRPHGGLRSPGPIGSARPVINGLLCLVNYPVDPVGAAARIIAGSSDFGDLESAALGYWRDPVNNALKLVSLTQASANLLSRVDGKTTVSALVELAGAEYGAEASDVLAFLELSCERGMLLMSGESPGQMAGSA
jgi:hypothetical protein